MRKVLLVDDHNLILGGLQIYMEGLFDIDYASTVNKAKEMLLEQDYYAVILDVSLGSTSGFDIVCEIPKRIYIFFLTMHKSSVYIKMAKDYGATGYFLKDESIKLLITALEKPISRSFWMSKSVENELTNFKENTLSNYDKLSPREQQVFSMLVSDISYKEIAHRLKISSKTVNNHRDHIMKKLDIPTQIGLVLKAVKLGIIT